MSFRTPFPASIFLASILGLAAAGVALADTNPAVDARQAQFTLYAHNLAVVGSMAQGRMDYDADAAQTAADNLYHLTRHDQGRMWPEGTDADSIEGTRALPEIWANLDDFTTKFAALQDAAEALQAVAGDGMEALRPAVGQLGGACAACHDNYRAEQ